MATLTNATRRLGWSLRWLSTRPVDVAAPSVYEMDVRRFSPEDKELHTILEQVLLRSHPPNAPSHATSMTAPASHRDHEGSLSEDGDPGTFPVVVHGMAAHWPLVRLIEHEGDQPALALTRCLAALPEVERDRLLDGETAVEVMANGGDYRDMFAPGSTRSLPSIITRAHREEMISNRSPPVSRRFFDQTHVPLRAVLDHMVALERGGDSARNSSTTRLYLAQHDLLQDPKWEPIVKRITPPPIPNLAARIYLVHTWLGPAGTLTPLHTDPYDNLLTQVAGSKTVALVPPGYDTDVARYTGADPRPLHNTSRLAVTNPRELPAQLPGVPVRVVEVAPGDALYIPRGWFHVVRADTASLSINFWWR
jgi:hypothetical protein